MNTLRFEMKSILQKKAEFTLFCNKQRHYEQGERAGKMLAHRIKQLNAQNIIPSIFKTQNKLITGKKEINKVFCDFYQKLYTSQGEVTTDEYEQFFSTIEMPCISSSHRDLLEKEITLKEVQNAIKSLRSGWAPGEDGYPSDFYKKFSDILAPRLLTVFHSALGKGLLPPSMRKNLITIIHKKGKDPQQYGSYRPRSLVNVDGKILAKILSNRLDNILPTIIHPDQVGFVKG